MVGWSLVFIPQQLTVDKTGCNGRMGLIVVGGL